MPNQGAQSRALIIASQTQGWDPTRIYDTRTGKYEDSIANFDKAPELFVNQQGTGSLPEGTPDGYPDGGFATEVWTGEPTCRYPEPREAADRGTSGADPYAGMGNFEQDRPAPMAARPRFPKPSQEKGDR